MKAQDHNLMVRIAEIEIYPEYIQEYGDILQKEAAASIQKEPGVIAIFPMFEKNQHHLIKIVEIYANKDAYESHLQTPHFLHYKTATMKMVKSLKLVDMDALDTKSMSLLFKKMAN
ncbi:antibiotic biosynthesis monooxygenase [Chitinophaga caeni]|uniref:Antibiotic biosynthesis monooxygenase n=2 Tax=Chitinophaga caeni TaxID=2029983 RepID=A0A291R1C3_9BACT|nr:antibiotic biosynthesis monooxygenase [Chitinophaga caeni]